MSRYFAPESSFIPPDYDQERTPCPDSCEGCRFESWKLGRSACDEFITPYDLQAAADELAIERFEEEENAKI